LLPDVDKFEPSGNGQSPLAQISEFVQTTCPNCGGPAKRDTDTMDGFACSSWYFLRFADPHNNEQAFDKVKAKYWLPVDDYIGGAEHAVMHLLYARMWTKVMYDAGLIDFNEPFKTLRNQGMILAPDGQKMSKSKGNTIEPDGLIEQGYGADAIRIMELFIGPWNQSASWSVEGLGGSYHFLQRVWTLVQNSSNAQGHIDEQQTDEKEIYKATHQAIKSVTYGLENLGFNVAVADLMEYVNNLYKLSAQDKFANQKAWQFAVETLLKLLAPFAPHIAEELWHQLGHEDSIHISEWPKYDEQYLVSETMIIVAQVNGKVRAELTVPSEADEIEIVAQATANERVKPYLEGKEIKKTVYVNGKLVNFVV
jgi:leucyl-tRNA synthetase